MHACHLRERAFRLRGHHRTGIPTPLPPSATTPTHTMASRQTVIDSEVMHESRGVGHRSRARARPSAFLIIAPHALTATTPRGFYAQVEHGFRRTPSAWRSASPSNRPVRTVRTGAYARVPSPVHEHHHHHDDDGFDTEPDSDAEEQNAAAGAAQPPPQDDAITILGLQAELAAARHALACAEREIHRRDAAAARARRVAAELEVATGTYWHPSRRGGK